MNLAFLTRICRETFLKVWPELGPTYYSETLKEFERVKSIEIK